MKHRALASAIYLCLAVTIFGTWLLAQWPGLFIYDTYVNIGVAYKSGLSPSVSHLYSYYLRALFQISKNPAILGIFQVGAASILSTIIFNRLWKKSESARPIIYGFGLFLIWPFNAGMNIFYTRDWLASWLHVLVAVFFAFIFIDFFYESKAREKRMLWVINILILFFLTLLASSVRQDSIVLVVMVPFLAGLILFRSKFNEKKFFVLSYAGLALLFAISVFLFRPHLTGPGTPDYQVTAIINPLSHFIHKGYKSNNHELDKATISKVLDYSLLESNYDPYEIPAYHKGAFRRWSTKEEFNELLATYLRMIRENPMLFLENRIKMWDGNMGHPRTLYLADDLGYPPESVLAMKERLGLEKKIIFPRLHRMIEFIATGSFYHEIPWSVFTRSQWWAFLFLVGIVICFRVVPITAAASLIILCRVVPVFLTAPAAQFKYLYSIPLFAFFALPLVYLEYSRRKALRADIKNRDV